MENDTIKNLLDKSQALLDIVNDVVKNSEIQNKNNIQMGSFSDSKKFVQIPRGSFLMGSNDYTDESPEHLVNINYDFSISAHQITVKEYLEFAISTKSNYPEWLTDTSNIKKISMNHYKNTNLNDDAPIVGISWENAKEYCSWRSKKEGKYYRLPTEAEWEYACKAGSNTRYNFGDDESELDKYAWYNKNANQGAHSVGTKMPNAWNIYDMHGNIWEWCEDIWNSNYELAPRDGSANKVGDANIRVLRGGSWTDSSRYVRSSNRNGYDVDGCDNDLGFRIVLESKFSA